MKIFGEIFEETLIIERITKMTSNIVLSGLTNISGTIRMPRNLTSAPYLGSEDPGSDLMTMEIPIKKLKLVPDEENSFEHSHFITKVDALSDEHYECMECQSKFEMSDQLLQHLDTHDYYFKGTTNTSNDDVTTDNDEKYDCAMCSYSLKSVRGTISEEEMAESLKKHIILEHFKANISPSVMEPPIEVPQKEPQLGLNNSEFAPDDDGHGNLKCSVCSTTFDQVYQRKIHERYFHSSGMQRNKIKYL